jgi:flagellar FliJ protein
MSAKRLDPLRQRAEQREEALAQELARRVQAHQQQAQRLDDLERFRGEYAQPVPPGAALTPGLLQNRASFLARIDEALGTQKKHLASSEEALAIERTRLLLASRDRLVLEKLAASYRSAEQRLQEQREQRVQDDLGARRHHDRREEKP